MNGFDAEVKATKEDIAGTTEMVNNDIVPFSEDNMTTLGFAEDAVSNHNKYRAIHGVGHLAWDNTLAQYALNYGKRCQFKHSGGENPVQES
jgi:uncharacterized protein YkwD